MRSSARKPANVLCRTASEADTPRRRQGVAWAGSLLALLAVGCLSPGDGQFLCAGPGAPCPEGMGCGTDGVCRVRPVGVDAGPAVCGDGEVTGSEECDDGNDDQTDGCAFCRILGPGEDGGPPPDGGPPSDGGPTPDGGTGDAGPLPSCAERGLDDRDRDGACGDVDCADDDAEVNPSAAEGCGGSSEARDDDCDGAVDEGCPFFLGVTHAPVRLHAPDSQHWGAWLNPSGQRLYTSPVNGTVPNTIQVATRANRAEAFGPPTAISGTADVSIYVIWLSRDELDVFAQVLTGAGVSRIYQASRGSPTAFFDVLSPIPSTVDPAGDQYHPTASPDGLELYYVHHVPGGGSYEIRRVTRPALGSPFGPPTTILSEGNPHFIRMSTDGHTLWFHRLSLGLFRLTRGDTSVPFGGDAVAEAGFAVEPSMILPFVHPAMGELWFTLANSDRRGPRPVSLFRAQLCRGGPCTPPTPVTCATAAGQVRSADGTRCYAATTAAGGGVGFARDQCEVVLPGSRLTSVHSQEMREEIAPFLSDLRWIGLNRESIFSAWQWDVPRTDLSGPREPMLWPDATDPRWASGEPSANAGDRCAVMLIDGTFDATDCTTGRLGICQRDVWPTW